VNGEAISIDGSFGEGGGQILRTSVGLAAALGRQIHVAKIRAGRDKPGLRNQHLTAVRAAAAVCGGQLTGDSLHSQELTFRPGRIRAGTFRFEVDTAGSTALVLQTIIPALMLADGESTVTVTGGTHNPFAPPFEYLRDVFAVLAAPANLQVYFELLRAGFYPAGGGKVKMAIRGVGSRESVAPVHFTERGELRHIDGVSATSSKLPEHIAERQSSQVLAQLAKAGRTGSIEQASWDADCPGTAVFVRAVFARSVAGFCSLGKKGKPAQRVADEAVLPLLEFINSAGVIDARAADQLVTIAALCPGESRFVTDKVTDHLRTNAEIVRQVTGRKVEITDSTDRGACVTIGAE